MGRAIIAREAGPVHAERDIEVLERNVVNDHVEGALHEGRIDRQKGLHPARRHAGGEEGGMLLRDPDIMKAVPMPGGKLVEPRPVGHRRGDGDDLSVVIGEIGKRLPEDLGVGGG